MKDSREVGESRGRGGNEASGRRRRAAALVILSVFFIPELEAIDIQSACVGSTLFHALSVFQFCYWDILKNP